jgi:hypothetical protein
MNKIVPYALLLIIVSSTGSLVISDLNMTAPDDYLRILVDVSMGLSIITGILSLMRNTNLKHIPGQIAAVLFLGVPLYYFYSISPSINGGVNYIKWVSWLLVVAMILFYTTLTGDGARIWDAWFDEKIGYRQRPHSQKSRNPRHQSKNQQKPPRDASKSGKNVYNIFEGGDDMF